MNKGTELKKEKPAAQIVLNRELTNHLLSVLETYETLDFDNRYSQLAAKLKDTILRFAKTKNYKGEDRAAIFLYEKEASSLIMLLTVYISSFAEEPKDLFSAIGKNKKGRE